MAEIVTPPAPAPSFADRMFPFMIGHRTQLIALTVGIVRALAMFGVVSHDVANMVEDLALPAGAVTLAAKVDRTVKQTSQQVAAQVEAQPIVVVGTKA